jgi:hypothetical protein
VHIAEVPGIQLSFRQRVEHERVVGIRAMGDMDGSFRHGGKIDGEGGEDGDVAGWR